jgi:urocanate hydratase
MRTSSILINAVVILGMAMATTAFVVPNVHSSSSSSLVTMYGYVPSGLTAEQWKQIKEKEAAKKANLGKVGPR